MPASFAITQWVHHGKRGPLLGEMDVSVIFGVGAKAQVYWINEPNLVGIFYPDKARVAMMAGPSIVGNKKIMENISRLKLGMSLLRLKGEKPKLRLKAPEVVKEVETPAAPRSKPQLKTKPKLELKRKKPKLKL